MSGATNFSPSFSNFEGEIGGISRLNLPREEEEEEEITSFQPHQAD